MDNVEILKQYKEEHKDLLPRAVVAQVNKGMKGVSGPYDAEILWVYANFIIGRFATYNEAKVAANKECDIILGRIVKVCQLSLEKYPQAKG